MVAARWEGYTPTVCSSKASTKPAAAASKVDLHGQQDNGYSKNLRGSHSTEDSASVSASGGTPVARRPSLQERLRSDSSEVPLGDKDMQVKDSHTARLKHILDEPAIRSLFREFLRANFCEENLSFWLDTQDFKRRFNTTSSAVATPTATESGPSASGGGGGGKGNRTIGHQAMERHQQDLIAMAFVTYNSESRVLLFDTHLELLVIVYSALPYYPHCSMRQGAHLLFSNNLSNAKYPSERTEACFRCGAAC